ncbi:MAG: hypothetical protein SRB1_00631 [Desulfobacteraceae bacterium Eth-SRB1]|nr:MAG: hypothetical protein SRB1_00631 [Desulfobacteraceae bacterium Eth-SRB1]
MEEIMEMPVMEFEKEEKEIIVNSPVFRTIPMDDFNGMPGMSFFEHTEKEKKIKANAIGKPLKTNHTLKVNGMKAGPVMTLNFKKV